MQRCHACVALYQHALLLMHTPKLKTWSCLACLKLSACHQSYLAGLAVPIAALPEHTQTPRKHLPLEKLHHTEQTQSNALLDREAAVDTS